jgi:hypothetical protein
MIHVSIWENNFICFICGKNNFLGFATFRELYHIYSYLMLRFLGIARLIIHFIDAIFMANIGSNDDFLFGISASWDCC